MLPVVLRPLLVAKFCQCRPQIWIPLRLLCRAELFSCQHVPQAVKADKACLPTTVSRMLIWTQSLSIGCAPCPGIADLDSICVVLCPAAARHAVQGRLQYPLRFAICLVCVEACLMPSMWWLLLLHQLDLPGQLQSQSVTQQPSIHATPYKLATCDMLSESSRLRCKSSTKPSCCCSSQHIIKMWPGKI